MLSFQVQLSFFSMSKLRNTSRGLLSVLHFNLTVENEGLFQSFFNKKQNCDIPTNDDCYIQQE